MRRFKKKSCFENKQVHLNFGGCSEVQLISITKIKNLVLSEFCKGISQCRIFWDKNNVRYFFGDKFKLLVPGSSNIATPPLVLQKYVACLLSCRLIKPLPWQPIFTKCETPNFQVHKQEPFGEKVCLTQAIEAISIEKYKHR